MPKPYPPEFRRRALDLLESGPSVRSVARSLGIAESCLHRCKQKDLVDRGPALPDPRLVESAAPAQAKARIAELENEAWILRKAAAAVERVVPPKDRYALIADLAVEGVPVTQACLALGVSSSGYYDFRRRAPSARSIRQAWLTDQITAVHQASREICGSPRGHAELVHGHGLVVSRKTVALLMRRAGLTGLPPSLGTVGDPYDNAVAEAFWGRMQTELLDRQRWKTRVELANAIFEYIEGFYNRRRRHSALDYMTPIQFETTHALNPVSSHTSP